MCDDEREEFREMYSALSAIRWFFVAVLFVSVGAVLLLQRSSSL